jgi:hypothetical protein
MDQYPATQPGWYPVDASGQLWWWDGYQWTGHRQVPDAYAVAATPSVVADPEPTIASRTAPSWLIALLPLAFSVLGVVLLVIGASPLAIWVALGLLGFVLVAANLGLGFWDVATLRSRGSSMAMAHALWVLLGGWVYLLVRAIMLKGSDRERWVLMVVNIGAGLVTTVVFVVGIYALFTDETFRREIFYQQASVEHTIERGVSNRAGFDVVVDCPQDPPIAQGDSFECTVTDTSGQVLGVATVTWTDNFGTFSWEAHPSTDPVSPQT